MQSAFLFTGFPGFLGRELLPRLLANRPGTRAMCLVQKKYLPEAREAAYAVEAREATLRGRIDLVAGDVTQPGLGLGEARFVRENIGTPSAALA